VHGAASRNVVDRHLVTGGDVLPQHHAGSVDDGHQGTAGARAADADADVVVLVKDEQAGVRR
jgi:hypothetical protein